MDSKSTEPPSAGSGTDRIEAFSDGVFAIAITLLILELKVPHAGEGGADAHLLEALLAQWPGYFAFVTSFATILIMWINHHTIFKQIRRSDHLLLLLNGLLLLCVTFVPFPTELVAEHVQHEGEQVAAAVYSGTFVVTAIAFNLLWRYAAHDGRLLGSHADPAFVRTITRQYTLGPPLYLLAFLLAFVHVGLSLAICLLLAVVFALPTSASRVAFES